MLTRQQIAARYYRKHRDAVKQAALRYYYQHKDAVRRTQARYYRKHRDVLKLAHVCHISVAEARKVSNAN